MHQALCHMIYQKSFFCMDKDYDRQQRIKSYEKMGKITINIQMSH